MDTQATATRPGRLDVLTIAAHPDDAEIGTGGTLLALKAQGWRVGVLDLTDGEPTPRGDHATRMREAEAASQVLGLDFRRTLDLPNRFLQDTIEARIAVAEVLRETRPRIMLIHMADDSHPDHVAAHRISEAARFYSKLSRTDWPGQPYHPPRLYCFHLTHKRTQLPVSFVVDISDHFETKLEAIACYRSQGPLDGGVEAARRWLDVEPRALYHGGLGGVRHGEAFYAPEPLVFRRGDALLPLD